MPFKGFTWNLSPSSAEILLIILLDVEESARYKIDRHMVGLIIDELLLFMEVAPNDSTPASPDGARGTKAARLDGYRDRRRRLR